MVYVNFLTMEVIFKNFNSFVIWSIFPYYYYYCCLTLLGFFFWEWGWGRGVGGKEAVRRAFCYLQTRVVNHLVSLSSIQKACNY